MASSSFCLVLPSTIHVMPLSQPDIHVFGHTHLNIDSTYNGIRFVQVCESACVP